jgi:single-stranded DNA-binding protein
MFALRSALPRASARAFSTTTPRSLAKMQLIGRLADTPSVNPTSTGRDVIKYAIGVSTGSKDENGNRGVSWFNVASFSEGAQKDLLLSLPKG